MRRLGKPGDLVSEDRAEGRPRLDLGVPVLDYGVPVPIDVPNIVEARQVRSRREIRQCHLIPRQPAPLVQKPGHVIKMELDLLCTGLDVFAVRITGDYQVLEGQGY